MRLISIIMTSLILILTLIYNEGNLNLASSGFAVLLVYLLLEPSRKLREEDNHLLIHTDKLARKKRDA